MGDHAVVIVLHVVFARPGHLDRGAHRLRNFHRFADEIGFETAPESAAEKRCVDEDGFRVEARDFGGRGLGTGLGLRGRPDVAAIRADMRRAIHRLHRGMRQEWNLVVHFNLCRRAGKSGVDIALFSGHRARLCGCIGEQFADARRW